MICVSKMLSRQKITDGLAAAKAADYSLRRWSARTRFVTDGNLPVHTCLLELITTVLNFKKRLMRLKKSHA